MKIAYLVNRYPAASHSFIRREIAALEAEGAEVSRFSVRQADMDALPDPRDRAEVEKTSVLLGIGYARLIWRLFVTILTRPSRAFQAGKIAFAKANWKPFDAIKRFAYLAEAAELARQMQAMNIDHLHAHFGTNPAMVARLASKIAHIPFSFTVHGPDEFDLPAPLDLAGKIADARFCVAISSFARSQLMRWSHIDDWTKIEVVRCGVEDLFFDVETLRPIPQTPRLCSVARLSGQKGIPLLLEAASRLKKQGQNFQLVLVGDGELRSKIEEMIAQLNLAAVVNITGWASADEVIEHLHGSRAMVLPSFAEGLPVVIMEALSLERPVIVSAIAGTPELVDQDCGWLIPAGSVDALVEAMAEALVADPSELAERGKEGRRRVVASHDARCNGAQLYRLFQSYRDRRP